jgi:hypothetical protein
VAARGVRHRLRENVDDLRSLSSSTRRSGLFRGRRGVRLGLQSCLPPTSTAAYPVASQSVRVPMSPSGHRASPRTIRPTDIASPRSKLDAFQTKPPTQSGRQLSLGLCAGSSMPHRTPGPGDVRRGGHLIGGPTRREQHGRAVHDRPYAYGRRGERRSQRARFAAPRALDRALLRSRNQGLDDVGGQPRRACRVGTDPSGTHPTCIGRIPGRPCGPCLAQRHHEGAYPCLSNRNGFLRQS